MPLLLVTGMVLLAAALGLGWRRREQALRQELDALADQLRELMARVEAGEQGLADALSSTGVAEHLLLEKGIADADEVEAVRRRLEGSATPPETDQALH